MPRSPEAAKRRRQRHRQRHQEKLRKYFQEYRIKNRLILNENSKKSRLQAKLDAFDAYGGARCHWCKEDDIDVLVIDHIDNNGHDHKDRKGYKCGSNRLYTWLRFNGYPTGFQVLCANCNLAKLINGGILPEGRRNKYLKEHQNGQEVLLRSRESGDRDQAGTTEEAQSEPEHAADDQATCIIKAGAESGSAPEGNAAIDITASTRK